MGNKQSLDFKVPCTALKSEWRDELREVENDNVLVAHSLHQDFIFLSFLNRRDARFLVRRNSMYALFWADFVNVARAREADKLLLLDAHDEMCESEVSRVTLGKIVPGVLSNTTFSVISLDSLLKTRRDTWVEMPFEALHWVLYHNTMLRAFADWRAMITEHRAGSLEIFADSWLAGNRKTQIVAKPTSDMDTILRDLRMQVQGECSSTLVKFMNYHRVSTPDTMELVNITLALMETARVDSPVDAQRTSCDSQPPFVPEETASGSSSDEDSGPVDEENPQPDLYPHIRRHPIHPSLAEVPPAMPGPSAEIPVEEDYVSVRVPRRVWVRLVRAAATLSQKSNSDNSK